MGMLFSYNYDISIETRFKETILINHAKDNFDLKLKFVHIGSPEKIPSPLQDIVE
jgi:hypothetical protein